MENEPVIFSCDWMLNMMSNKADCFITAWLLSVEF